LYKGFILDAVVDNVFRVFANMHYNHTLYEYLSRSCLFRNNKI